MPKISRLTEERDAYFFLQRVLGDVNLLEAVQKRFNDPAAEVSSDDFMYLHFNKMASVHRAFLADPQRVAAFRRLHPTHAHLVEYAKDLADSLDRLHLVREELLTPHLDGKGQDVQRHQFLGGQFSPKDRAALSGMTESQLQNFESQLTKLGHTKLTSVERQRLSAAIAAELE